MDCIYNIESLERKLKGVLDEKRYKHSIGVKNEAEKMAVIFGVDREKAIIAGLLHDCAKRMSFEESLEYCNKHNVELDDWTMRCPPVLHAPVGAVVAEYEYGISDSEILDAIRFHTVARQDMTLLDKIIYVADMTEPNRDFNGVSELRELSRKDIDSAYREAIFQSFKFNLEKGSIIHPNTVYAWNEICRNKHK